MNPCLDELSQLFMKKRIVFFLMLALCFCACKEQAPPAGVVATVNGEPVYLHSLQTLLDSRTAALGIPPRPSLDEMRNNYAQALSVLITHALVRQELEQKGISLHESDYAALMDDINRDFSGESLDGVLDDSSIRKDDWQQLVRDYLALETFRRQVLLPGIKTDLDEVKAYYRQHEADFLVPASMNVCFVSSEKKEEVENICASAAKAAASDNPAVQCMDADAGELPAPWQNDAKNMKLFDCGKISEQYGAWRSMFVTRKDRERLAPLAEVYPLIDNILLAQKKDAAFDKWLESRIAASDIKVSPELNESLSFLARGEPGMWSGGILASPPRDGQ